MRTEKEIEQYIETLTTLYDAYKKDNKYKQKNILAGKIGVLRWVLSKKED